MNFSTDHDYSQLVSPESLERELKRVRAAAAGAAQGVFGSRRSPGKLIGRVQSFSEPVVRYC